MTDLIRPLALALAIGLVSPAFAQTSDPAPEGGTPPAEGATDAAAPAEGDAGFATGKEVGGPGQSYNLDKFDDWELNCIRTEDGSDPCQLYQLLKDAKGNPVAEINLTSLADGGKAVAGATIITPLETLLTEELTLGVDGGKSKRYPFTFCAAIGCISRVGLTAEDLAAFKKGSKATVTIVPVAAPTQKVTADISLKGFTAAFDAVSKIAAEGGNKTPPAP